MSEERELQLFNRCLCKVAWKIYVKGVAISQEGCDSVMKPRRLRFFRAKHYTLMHFQVHRGRDGFIMCFLRESHTCIVACILTLHFSSFNNTNFPRRVLRSYLTMHSQQKVRLIIALELPQSQVQSTTVTSQTR